jgi:hypothetical protein
MRFRYFCTTKAYGQLYHAHPPTGWIRFEGKLRPHCFDLNQLTPGDQRDSMGMPIAFLGNRDVMLYVSRRADGRRWQRAEMSSAGSNQHPNQPLL